MEEREEKFTPIIDEEIFRTATEQAPEHKKFIHPDTPEQRLENIRFFTLALAGEAGEICNLVKKEWRGTEPEYFYAELVNEISDVFIYLCLLMANVGINPAHNDCLNSAIKAKKRSYFEKMEKASND